MSETRGETCELSIVMPCLNEAETIATCVRKARQFLQQNGVDGEIIVADNGSTDSSRAIAAAMGARVVVAEKRGYGSALMQGIAAARGRYVIMGDADDSYDFLALRPFLDKLRAGYDLVLGNRFAGGIRPGAMPFLHRHIGNPLLSGLARLMFRSPIHDFHCGLRGFRKEAILRLDLRTTGMEFATEMIVKATLHGMRVAEVPTTLYCDGRSRRSHLRPWRDGWRHLRFLLLYSPRWLFLYPGSALMLLGTAFILWLLPGPRTIGGMTLDTRAFIYAAAAIIIGFQAINFAVFAKFFAISVGLLPKDSGFDRVFRFFNLELGLAAGATLLVFGLGILMYQALVTPAAGPPLSPPSLRPVVIGVLSLTLGLQTILSSFFLSILGLSRR